MLFSVLIPCYNSAAFVASTVNSFLSQEFEDAELILLNDGSSDETMDVINVLARQNSRIRTLDQKNGGISIARNHLMAEAKGEWIVFLDHDDMLLPNALSDIRRLIHSFPETECFVFPCRLKDENGEIVERVEPVFRDCGDKSYSGAEAFRLLYSEKKYRNQHWQVWRFVFRRECRPYFVPGVIHEDLDTMPLYIAGLRSVCIAAFPHCLYTMDSPHAVTHSFSPRRVNDMCSVTARLYGKMDQIASGESNLHLSDKVIQGFKALLAFNIYGYYQAAALFAEPQRSEILAFFEAHKSWLLAIENPRFYSFLKKISIRVLGVKKSAGFFLFINRVKCFFNIR